MLFGVEVATPITPFTIMRISLVVYNPYAVLWNNDQNIPRKAKVVEVDIAQSVARSGRVYKLENLFQ